MPLDPRAWNCRWKRFAGLSVESPDLLVRYEISVPQNLDRCESHSGLLLPTLLPFEGRDTVAASRDIFDRRTG